MVFFTKQITSLTLAEILDITKCGVDDGVCLDSKVTNIAPLHLATQGDVSFFHNKKYKQEVQNTRAGFCIISAENKQLLPQHTIAIISDNPYLHYTLIANQFFGYIDATSAQQHTAIHPSSVVEPCADIGASVVVEPFVYIGKKAKIGNNCIIKSHATIGHDVVIGDRTVIGNHVSINYTKMGSDCLILDGARVGSRGFGFVPSVDGQSPPIRTPHAGSVIIEDHVEIGANTTIDRGSLGDTTIGYGTSIDNLVQIAHNCHIGRCCIMAGKSALAGSVTLQDYVVLGGAAKIAGHVFITSGAKIYGNTAVISDITEKGEFSGYPAVKARDFFKMHAKLRRLI
jgi:UDP-3-O-[3-hydroxymyristoyl] glucosamine N-acyltransferase